MTDTGRLFDPGPEADTAPPEHHVSADRRRTEQNEGLLATGVHPATRRPLAYNVKGSPGAGHTCGDCAHHHAYDYHNRAYHKCDSHRLGESHSAASDIRVGWPACTLWEARDD